MNTMIIDKKSLNYEKFTIIGDYIKIEIFDEYFLEPKIISKILDKQIRFFEKHQDDLATVLESPHKHDFYFDIEIHSNEKYLECFMTKVENSVDELTVWCRFNKSLYVIEV